MENGEQTSQIESRPKPEPSVSSVYNFAYTLPIVLEMITRYLSGIDILALCQTCSHPLLMRLLKGAIHRFDITPATPRTWNGLEFTYLKYMSRLEICQISSSTLKIWNQGPKMFDALPASLRVIKLTIPFKFAEWLLVEPQRSELGRKGKITKKARQAVNTSAKVTFKLMDQFPVLEALHLTGGLVYSANSYLPSHIRLEHGMTLDRARGDALESFFSSLPKSVTKLTLPMLGSHTWKVYQVLSEKLIDLAITCHTLEIPAKGFSKLPPRLSSLSIDAPFCKFLETQPLFPDLPQDLEHFQFMGGSTTLFQTSLSGFSRLTSLRSVELDFTNSTFKVDCLACWPQALESLKIVIMAQDIFSAWFHMASFANLPRKLFSFILKVSTLRWLDRRRSLLPFEGFDAFPSTLTNLSLGDAAIITDLYITQLPRDLTSLNLDLHQTTCADHICTDNCSADCALDKSHDSRLFRLTSECSAALPYGLTSLRIANAQFKEQFYATLPPDLKSLEIETPSVLSADVFTSLPSGLTSLKILGGAFISTAAYERLSCPLVELHITSGLQRASPTFFQCLPVSLTRLCLEDNVNVSDDCLRHIPRSLTELRLSKAGERLTSACGQWLPRGLSIFQVKSITLAQPRPTTEAIIKAFPHAVPIFDLNWLNAKGKSVKLPTSSPHRNPVEEPIAV